MYQHRNQWLFSEKRLLFRDAETPRSPEEQPEVEREKTSVSEEVNMRIARAQKARDEAAHSLEKTRLFVANNDQEQSEHQTPLSVEKIKERDAQRLETYRSLSKEELIAAISTPEAMEKHQKDGTLYVLFLAIDSKGRNAVEETSKPAEYYKEMIDGFVEEGMAFRKKLTEAESMSTEDIKEKLQHAPYDAYFTQEKNLPAADFSVSALDEKQLRALYASCLLEEQVRSAEIAYGGDSFYTVLMPKDKWVIERQGDCNAVANYYVSLASFSGSERLQKTIGLIMVDGHAQLCFDLGKDTDGKPVMFSKNTSYVDMNQVDADGRQKEGAAYAHNFYDFSHDAKKYGLDPSANTHKIARFVASELGETTTVESVKDADNAALRKDFELCEKSLAIHAHNPTNCDNAIQIVWELHERKEMTDADVQTKMKAILTPYIESSYLSAFSIANIYETFDADQAAPFIELYEGRINKDKGVSFSNFILSSFADKENPAGIDQRNAKRVLNIVSQLVQSNEAQLICKKIEIQLQEISGAKE